MRCARGKISATMGVDTHVEAMAERAGLRLDDRLKAQLYESAVPTLAMASRIRRDFGSHEAPASGFIFHGR